MTWDGTINLGILLGVFSAVAAIVKYGNKVTFAMLLAQRDVTELKKDVQEMKPKIEAILTLQANQSAFDQRLNRLESKVDGGR